MNKRILITGGAGFLGSHLADELLQSGYEVRALDALSPQVHEDGARPAYLSNEVELQTGDMRDAAAVERALENVDGVVHLAAAVGVGQSMYEIVRYTDINNIGTAVLLEALSKKPVERLVVASSMSIYGEGLYQAPDGELVAGGERSLEQLKARQWEVRDANGAILTPVPTPETKEAALVSVYALSKYDQEKLCLIVGRAYGIPTTALRFFNIYGPRQSLSNPYTGVLAIFAARYLNNQPPLINEDGEQKRDFVHVRDVARACRLALEKPAAIDQTFNIGSGRALSVNEIAEHLARVLDKSDIEPMVAGKYRVGDIRHCFADISKAQTQLGYEPRVGLDEGMDEMAQWLEGQVAIDRAEEAGAELAARGLTV